MPAAPKTPKVTMREAMIVGCTEYPLAPGGAGWIPDVIDNAVNEPGGQHNGPMPDPKLSPV